MKDRGQTRYTRYTKPLNEGGVPYGGGGTEDCGRVMFETKLVKQKPLILSKLKRGDLLSIVFDTKRVLTVLDPTGNICGCIAAASSGKLMACMDKGFEYVAKLLNSVGDVKVMIKP